MQELILALALLLLTTCTAAVASICPKDINDTDRVMTEGPKVLLESLSKVKHTHISTMTPGKESQWFYGASGFNAGGEVLFLAVAHNKTLGQTASGVLRCDANSGNFSIIKSAWGSNVSDGFEGLNVK